MDVHTFGYETDTGSVEWDVRDFWEMAKSLPVVVRKFDAIIALVSKNIDSYDNSDWERVDKADTRYPIILAPDGLHILDGVHRMVKFRKMGKKYCKQVILPKMPLPVSVSGKPFEIEGIPFQWKVKET